MCTIPSYKFVEAPFNLAWGSNLIAKVIAINIKGASIESDAGSGGIILTEPDAPVNLVNLPLITNANSVGLDWQNGANDGGSPVIDYRVSYKTGMNLEFVTLESNIVSLPYTAKPLLVGIYYAFKVQSRNTFGYSEFSDAVIVLVAQIPDAPVEPLTIIDGADLKIDWIAPFEQGSPITSY